jgi:hypothetical protein
MELARQRERTKGRLILLEEQVKGIDRDPTRSF